MLRFWAFFVLVLIARPGVAQTFSINGSFSLPPGVVATQGGAQFEISTDPREVFQVGGGTLESSAVVTIAAFSGSSSYVLTLKDDANPDLPTLKKLRFSCLSGCNTLGVTTNGYWSLTDGVVGTAKATEFSATQNYTVDIDLSEADVFSGTVRLPDAFIASGVEQIQVSIKASSFTDPAIFSQVINPQAGQAEWPFLVGVPRLVGVGGWSVELNCIDCAASVAAETHFPTTRDGDPMTLDTNRKFFFLKSTNYPDMQMTFMSVRQPTVSNSLGGIMSLLLGDR